MRKYDCNLNVSHLLCPKTEQKTSATLAASLTPEMFGDSVDNVSLTPYPGGLYPGGEQTAAAGRCAVWFQKWTLEFEFMESWLVWKMLMTMWQGFTQALS